VFSLKLFALNDRGIQPLLDQHFTYQNEDGRHSNRTEGFGTQDSGKHERNDNAEALGSPRQHK
jgi:hypothetical protein